MKTIQTALTASFFPFSSLPSGTALFDIETTGLSADTSYLYLIGAVHQTEEGPFLTQWFCEEYSEEKQLLLTFQSFLEKHGTLVHYNGCGFDLPYLNKKFARHKIRCRIEPDSTTDIYKLLLPYRKVLTLPDFKQKTLEALCGFLRTDPFDGEDLIDVYAAYTGKFRLASLTGQHEEANALSAALLLHNHDDLLGLLALYQHTNLAQALSGTRMPEMTQTEHSLCFRYPVPLLPFCGYYPLYAPSRRSTMNTPAKPFGTLSVTPTDTELSIRIHEGELKYFFANYKDYTYLIYEDAAIHNSLAEYVDREAKQKCVPATAYQKKSGLFLPLPFQKLPDFTDGCYLFYPEYKSSPAYAELSSLSDTNGFPTNYVASLFSAMPKLMSEPGTGKGTESH